MTGLILFSVAAYLAAVLIAYLMHPTIAFGAELTPLMSYGVRAKITTRFTVKGAGMAHTFSILVPFFGIEDQTNAAIKQEVIGLADAAVSRWALRPRRNPDELRKELARLSSPCFTVVRCSVTDMEIPPEPKLPEPRPKPKSHAEQMLDEFDDRLFGTSLLINRVSSTKKMYPELWEDPIGKQVLPRILDAMKGRILTGEPSKQSYRGYAAGTRENRENGLG
jgi:hypothetical protein